MIFNLHKCVLIFWAFMSLGVLTANAQDDEEIEEEEQPTLIVEGKLEVLDDDTNGAIVELQQYGEVVKSKTLNRIGKFKFEVEFDSDYEIIFKKTGCIKKRIELSTHVPTEILEENPEFPEFWFDETIYREYEGVDTEIFNLQTAGEILYNKEFDSFEYTDFHLDDHILAEIESLREKASKEEQDYNEAIKKGDKLFDDKKYADARKEYQTAMVLNPEAKYPGEKISEIDVLLDDLARKKAEKDVIDAQYRSAVKWADKSFSAEKYSEALTGYNQALQVKPDDKYAKDRLRETKKRISEKNEEERTAKIEEYRRKINQATEALKQQEFEHAKKLFVEAQKLRPEEEYPKNMLAKIDDLKKQAAEEKANYEAQLDWYKKTLENADKAREAEKFDEAKELYKTVVKYQKEFKFKQDDQYPRKQLIAIENILLERNKTQKEIENRQMQYNKAIVEADNAFRAKNYRLAKSAYNKALDYIADDSHAKARITECDEMMAKNKKLQEEYKQKEEDYKNHIADADKAYKDKIYDKAKENYNKALALFPDRPYPKKKLEGIDQLIAEQKQIEREFEETKNAFDDAISVGDIAFEEKKWNEAKEAYRKAISIMPKQPYPRNRIDEIEKIEAKAKKIEAAKRAKDESYSNTFAKAEEAYTKKDYRDAKHYYELALKIKPDEQLPQNRIDEIDAIVEAKRKAEQERIANENAYNEALKEGNMLMTQQKYEDAITAYRKSLEHKPDELVPQQKIKDAKEMIASIKKIEAERKAKEEKYNSLIAQGDDAFKAEKFDEARNAYNEALKVKTSEKYPMAKIAEMDRIIAQRAKEEAEQKAREEAYNKAITRAEEAMKGGRLADAKQYYLHASKQKPDETLPKQKIDEIDQLITQKEKEEKARIEKENAYKKEIATAESHFDNKKYSLAKEHFKKAGEIDPKATTPQKRIDDIDKILKQNEASYNEAIAKADEAFNKKDYSVAEFYYKKAFDLRAEKYPESRIAESQKMAGEEKNTAKNKEYDDNIKLADKAFNSNDFTVAEFYYNKALEIKADNYPTSQIEKIKQKRDDIKQKEIEKKYKENIAEADKLFEKKEYSAAKFYYDKALKIKENDKYASDKIKEISKEIAKGGN